MDKFQVCKEERNKIPLYRQYVLSLLFLIKIFFLSNKRLGILPCFMDKRLLGLGSGKTGNTMASGSQDLMNLFCGD